MPLARRLGSGLALFLVLASCGDDGSSTTETSDGARAFFRDYFTTELTNAGISQSSIDCVVTEVVESDAVDALETVNFDDPNDPEAVQALADFLNQLLGSDCLTDDELVALAPNQSIPSSFGDHAALDELWTRCEDGEFTACDLLLFVSGSPTDYERFGLTCGGRSAGDEPDPCVFQHGSGPDLDRLATQCREGEFGSCDLLAIYPTDSESIELGATCGKRIEASEVACFFRFGTRLRE